MEALNYRQPEKLPEEIKAYNSGLVDELLQHHEDDLSGMYEEEVGPFLAHLEEISRSDIESQETRIAARKFLEKHSANDSQGNDNKERAA